MMKVWSGHSQEIDSKKAVREAIQNWPQDQGIDLILAFHSTKQDAREVAVELARLYPNAQIAGCTSAGEHLNGQHYKGSLVLTAVHSPEINWKVGVIENLKQFKPAQAQSLVEELFTQLNIDEDLRSPERQFCLTFIDGLSCKEEAVSAAIADALEGLPMLGGSAGDDLAFKRTQVIANGKAYDNAAVVVIADSREPFQILKHQHFIKTPRQLVITKVDTAARRVYEIDGLPAVEAYAGILGVKVEELNSDLCFINPLTFRVDGEIYVRSIQKLEDDGSIVFYCGVEEGMVLEIGGHEEMDRALERDLQVRRQLQPQSCQLFLACNCILRALEADQVAKHEDLGRLVKGFSQNIVGFDTYGEQLNGLHINQTLVGIALGRAA